MYNALHPFRTIFFVLLETYFPSICLIRHTREIGRDRGNDRLRR